MPGGARSLLWRDRGTSCRGWDGRSAAPSSTRSHPMMIAIVLLFDKQFENVSTAPTVSAFARAAVWLVIGLTALNAVSTLLECGFGACADNPVVYELLKR